MWLVRKPNAPEFAVLLNQEGPAVQYNAVAGNPFAVLTAIVAPAILTNASSVLALGTSNRLARVVDRTRIVASQLATFEPGMPDHQLWSEQLAPLHVRSQLLVRIFFNACAIEQGTQQGQEFHGLSSFSFPASRKALVWTSLLLRK